MLGQPGTVHAAVMLAATERDLYALRDDGAVFILLKRGTIAVDGEVLSNPRWIQAPAVPGTIAAIEQEG